MARDILVETGRPILRPGQALHEDSEPRELIPGFTYRFRTPGDDRYRGVGAMVGSFSEVLGNEVVGFVKLERPGGRIVEVQEAHLGPVITPRVLRR